MVGHQPWCMPGWCPPHDHVDHACTKVVYSMWETIQLGSHVDWWNQEPISRQQQPSGIKDQHCNDWLLLRVTDRKVTLMIVIDLTLERRPAEQCRLAAMH